MFTELIMPLVRRRPLLISVSLVEGEKIRVTVVSQKSADTEDGAAAGGRSQIVDPPQLSYPLGEI